jgi:syntaxin 5
LSLPPPVPPYCFRIEDSMDTTLDHAEHAHKNLLKTLENLTGNRKLILKVFAVLSFFVILFMLFFA